MLRLEPFGERAEMSEVQAVTAGKITSVTREPPPIQRTTAMGPMLPFRAGALRGQVKSERGVAKAKEPIEHQSRIEIPTDQFILERDRRIRAHTHYPTAVRSIVRYETT
jgi:hypothetical protein